MIRRNIANLGLVNGTIAIVISVVQDTNIDYIEKSFFYHLVWSIFLKELNFK